MEENQSFLELEIDNEASANLMEVSRWGKFLGILILVCTGLAILLFAVLWNRISSIFLPLTETPDSAKSVVMIVVAFMLLVVCAIVAILMNFLIKGAVRIHKGLLNKDQLLFNSGLANLKNYFLMYGILGIIQLVFSIIGLLAR